MKTKHTSGSWTIGKPNKDTFYVLSNESFICMLPTKEKNAEANARLIAAAPDLLEYLAGFASFCAQNKQYIPTEKREVLELFMDSAKRLYDKITK